MNSISSVLEMYTQESKYFIANDDNQIHSFNTSSPISGGISSDGQGVTIYSENVKCLMSGARRVHVVDEKRNAAKLVKNRSVRRSI